MFVTMKIFTQFQFKIGAAKLQKGAKFCLIS